MPDLDRLQRTLGLPALAWIVARLRQRLERGEPLTGTVSLADPSSEQRDALARLFGNKLARGERLSVQLEALEKLLFEAEVCGSLSEAVVLLAGPLGNERQAAAAKRQQWDDLFTDATATIERVPGWADYSNSDLAFGDRARRWLRELQDSGLLRRMAREDLEYARGLLHSAIQSLGELPARGVPLAEFAARTVGDSHALDAGESLAVLVLRGISVLHNVRYPENTESRRDAWASVGVLCDELSAPVLVLNLRAEDASTTAQALRLHADAGEPYRLSLRQLMRDVPSLSVAVTGEKVFVCENPTVVAAAANQLGPRSRPLVCLEGEPKSAGKILLGQLAASSVNLQYHGDFDWPGIAIANRVMERQPVTPWRMDEHSYRQFAVSGKRKLTGEPAFAEWDERLGPAMLEIGLAVYEEQVLESLLGDLCADD